MIIGSHVGMSGDKMMLGSVEEALSYNATAFMIYTGAPQNTNRKPLSQLKIKEAHELMNQNNLELKNIIVHAPYIVNPGTFFEDKRDFCISFLTQEVERAYEMGSKILVLHPGNTLKNSLEDTISNIGYVLNCIINNTKELDVVIALETMSGKGTEVGRTFEEINSIINLVEDKSRVGVCLDTCHIHDGGYDIVNDYEGVKHSFKSVIGLGYLKVIHINDSKNVIGAHKDRHANINEGYIGLETIAKVCHDEDFIVIPKILETPYIDGIPPYKEEINIIKSYK